MPSSGNRREDAAERAGAVIAAYYAQLEADVIAAVAQAVQAVLAGKLVQPLAARNLRLIVLALIAQFEREIRPWLARIPPKARAEVEADLREELGQLATFLPPLPQRSLASLNGTIRSLGVSILQQASAWFSAVLAAALAAGAGLGALAAAQAMLDELAAAGLVGIIDTLGRRWDLTSYAEMAVRTAVSRLYLALHLDGLRATGNDLVYVARSSTKPPCAKCQPYVHKVLSLTGRTTGFVSALGPNGVVTIRVTASVEQARAAGLLHQNCRDSLVMWQPGMKLQRPPPWSPERYKAAQERRTLLREYRRAERILAAAMSRRARTVALRLVRYLRDLPGRQAA